MCVCGRATCDGVSEFVLFFFWFSIPGIAGRAFGGAVATSGSTVAVALGTDQPTDVDAFVSGLKASAHTAALNASALRTGDCLSLHFSCVAVIAAAWWFCSGGDGHECIEVSVVGDGSRYGLNCVHSSAFLLSL